MIDKIKTDIASAENCKDNVNIVNSVTVIKNEVLGFKNTDNNIAKNGNGNKNTDQFIGKNIATIATNKEKVATINMYLLFKNFGSKNFK